MTAAPANKRLSKQHGSWIIIAPLAAATVAYLTLSFVPGMKALHRIHEELQTNQDYVAQSDATRKALDQTEKELVKAETYIKNREAQLPADGRLMQVLADVSGHAKAAGTAITKFEPKPALSYDTLRRVPVTLGLDGSFSELFQLVSDLEQMKATVWINELQFDAPREGSQKIHAEAKLELFVGNSEKSD